jgi:hypothetical protein
LPEETEEAGEPPHAWRRGDGFVGTVLRLSSEAVGVSGASEGPATGDDAGVLLWGNGKCCEAATRVGDGPGAEERGTGGGVAAGVSSRRRLGDASSLDFEGESWNTRRGDEAREDVPNAGEA